MPLIRKVDCVRFHVPDLEAGLSFYRDRLGHELIWRTETAAGLRLPDSGAEIVIQTERQDPETDLLVESADEAARLIEQAGGQILVPPFDIQIGRCVVVAGSLGEQARPARWKQGHARNGHGRECNWKYPTLNGNSMTLKRQKYPMPDYIRSALSERGLMDAYSARPAYQQNDYIGWITRAKLEATKQKRLNQMLDELEGGKFYMKMEWTK